MKKDSRQFSKSLLRARYKEILASLTAARRGEAARDLTRDLLPLATGMVLSFASKSDEIDMTQLNIHLAKEGRLVLPRMEGALLELYRVTDYSSQLVSSTWYIDEPNPDLCSKVALTEINVAFVPGLAFDKTNNRLGYGKGLFDRLLSTLSLPAYGIGFLEQLYEGGLPIEAHDIPLTAVYLY